MQVAGDGRGGEIGNRAWIYNREAVIEICNRNSSISAFFFFFFGMYLFIGTQISKSWPRWLVSGGTWQSKGRAWWW